MADWIPVAAAVVVGLVFLAAGASKVSAGPGWTAQARGLGAPSFTFALIPVVPWIEIVIGALLVVQIGRRPAALGALAMLVVFTILIAMQLAQGRRPPCACFGAWSAKPIGAGHLVRNALLILLSVVAAL